MAFSKALRCIVCVLVVSFAQAEVNVGDLSGVWKGYVRATAAAILTPQGPNVACVDTFPAECVDQLPLSEQTYIFNGTTVSYQARDRVGILTKEQSAALTPACAKNGIYPIETAFTVPPSDIIAYDSKAERLFSVDPRRPNDTNCVQLGYRAGEDGPYIEVEHNVIIQGTLESIIAMGSLYVCESLSVKCFMEVNEEGEINAGTSTAISLTCIEGDCLNGDGAAVPSAAHTPSESLLMFELEP